MVDTAIKVIFSDKIIEQMIDLVIEAQQKENTRLPVLKDQLRDTEKRLANLLEAIEQGILTPTTKAAFGRAGSPERSSEHQHSGRRAEKASPDPRMDAVLV